MAEQKAEPTGRGALRPAYAPLQALRYHLPKMYERMVQVTQVLGAGGLLINPMEADLRSEIGADIARYYRGAGVDAEQRIRALQARLGRDRHAVRPAHAAVRALLRRRPRAGRRQLLPRPRRRAVCWRRCSAR